MVIIHTEGTRKRAVARATVRTGTGRVVINKRALEMMQPDVVRLRMSEPLLLAGEMVKGLDIEVVVRGGGLTGQADAVRLAMARALVEHDRKLKPVFSEYDRLLLVADVRQNEVSKPNDSKPRDKRQKSYR